LSWPFGANEWKVNVASPHVCLRKEILNEPTEMLALAGLDFATQMLLLIKNMVKM